MDPLRRIQVGVGALLLVIVGGTVGYVILGFGVLDALYQTVTTITTVGFREVQPLKAAGQIPVRGVVLNRTRVWLPVWLSRLLGVSRFELD